MPREQSEAEENLDGALLPVAGEGGGWGQWGLTASPHLHLIPYFEALDTDNSCSLTFMDANY